VISGAAGSVGLVSLPMCQALSFKSAYRACRQSLPLLGIPTQNPDSQIATQIALAHPKCKVVAIAGSADKCAKLKEMGCHVVINYKDQGWQKQLKQVGLVDVYFDNGQSSALARATVL